MLNKAIIGKKVGMTQIFNADGKVIPCTVIEAASLRCNSAQDRREGRLQCSSVRF